MKDSCPTQDRRSWNQLLISIVHDLTGRAPALCNSMPQNEQTSHEGIWYIYVLISYWKYVPKATSLITIVETLVLLSVRPLLDEKKTKTKIDPSTCIICRASLSMTHNEHPTQSSPWGIRDTACISIYTGINFTVTIRIPIPSYSTQGKRSTENN